jgi:hypothetical protein
LGRFAPAFCRRLAAQNREGRAHSGGNTNQRSMPRLRPDVFRPDADSDDARHDTPQAGDADDQLELPGRRQGSGVVKYACKPVVRPLLQNLKYADRRFPSALDLRK